MSSKAEGTSTGAAKVDPDVAVFVAELAKGYAGHGQPGTPSPTVRRQIAEKVRERWRAGGPVMAETREFENAGLRMRLHLPEQRDGLPVMLYIHGGGWVLFSVDTHDRLMREYAARAGVAVLGIDYSLAPENRFPVALEEIVAAIDWLEQEGVALGIDPTRIVVGGDSAGANLSVAACLKRRDQGKPALAGMLLNYGAFDPQRRESYKLFSGPEFTLEADEMDVFWQTYVGVGGDLTDPLVAPILADLHDLPPAFMAIAECDVLVDSNLAFAERLAAAGVSVEAVTYEGATHSFLEAMSIAPLANRALDDEARWLRERLQP